MNLREFVKETLVQVCEGVKEAQQAVQATGAVVSPDTGHTTRMQMQSVEFDVAVTVSEEGEKTGNAGLTVMGQGLRGQVSASTATTEVSRVRFQVPVLFAAQQVPGDEPLLPSRG